MGWSLPEPSSTRALALITRGYIPVHFLSPCQHLPCQVTGPVVRECFWGGMSVGTSHRCWYLGSALGAFGGGPSDYKRETWALHFKRGQRTPEDFVVFLCNFSSSWGLALLTLVITSSEYYFDLYSQRRICWRIKMYMTGQLSWSLVNNSVYLASGTITALGSRLEFYKCNQKLAFPTCVPRLLRTRSTKWRK